VGRKISLEKMAGQPVWIRNDGDYPARVSVRVAEIKESFVQPPGGSLPGDLKWCKVWPRKLTVPPHGQKKLKGFIKLPENSSRGKRYHWAILLENLDRRAPVEKLGRIFIETKK
jgi:Ni,Fe-hydrogenase III large subunit